MWRTIAAVALVLLDRGFRVLAWVAVGITILTVALVVVVVLGGGIQQEASETEYYASIEEAEQVAGFHIPRAGPEYPVNYTLLTWDPGKDLPLSETSYEVPGIPRRFFGLEVGPRYYYPYPTQDRPTVEGEPMTIGGKSGWIVSENEFGWDFAFECGSVDDLTVWCEAGRGRDEGFDAFEAFIASIH
jgi:hypothetical protein